SQTYILEPSPKQIITYMESVMVEIALGQVVLESKLAQYASRFNAMYAAKSKAKEMKDDLSLTMHRAKRAFGDERIKEILSGMKMLKKRNAE
ncbi:MAG TPA: F0F1 ATP synthase subunit gamma, partial [Candidatus Polarisedimenticolaceae bacterium]|nr:F0F1 ATP synthase subunit gamma [Candidatus Polarisedimenticolaceae bacterium]